MQPRGMRVKHPNKSWRYAAQVEKMDAATLLVALERAERTLLRMEARVLELDARIAGLASRQARVRAQADARAKADAKHKAKAVPLRERIRSCWTRH
jgi:hypothetical protein